MNLTQKHSLKSLNTLAIDSVADFFVEAVSLDDVQSALSYAKQHNLAVKVLGGGSNVVMADRISGLVLKYAASQYRLLSETNEAVTIEVDAGFEWHAFVLFCLNKGWFGLENLSYIPGTVGAAPVHSIFDLGKGAQIIAPGRLDRSVMLRRIISNGPERMPPVGGAGLDAEWVKLFTTWVSELKKPKK